MSDRLRQLYYLQLHVALHQKVFNYCNSEFIVNMEDSL